MFGQVLIHSIVGRVDPVEVWSRETQDPGGREGFPAAAQEIQPLLERKVLEEVLGVDSLDIFEGQPLPDVENSVHARQRLVVDVQPPSKPPLPPPDPASRTSSGSLELSLLPNRP